jgi:hypothetical protein
LGTIGRKASDPRRSTRSNAITNTDSIVIQILQRGSNFGNVDWSDYALIMTSRAALMQELFKCLHCVQFA